MSRPDHIFVFTYDVSRNSARTKLAALLDGRMDRVQRSVFEARMTVNEARALAERAANLIGPDDSLRAYCVTEPGRNLSIVHGVGALPEADDFVLL
jgi:CRISPR-associated protein Cas2